MKCPFCDTEMLHGYLNCGRTIWSERKHKISLLSDGKEKFALLLGQPKPTDNEFYNKMTPFFGVNLGNRFQSCHYGTELYI